MASTCFPGAACAGLNRRRSVFPDPVQVLQSLVVLAAAPLYAGVLTRAEAVVGSKRGPSVLQPYRDLAKLLRKGSAISDQASWVFRGAPFVAFACYLTVSVIVPIITDDPLPLAFLADLIGGAFVLALASFVISLAALDTASPFGGLGASRTTWIGSIAEPALILVFFTVGRGVALRQPVPDEPRDRGLRRRAGAADPPAGAAGVLHDRAGRERPDPDRQPERVDRDLDDRGRAGARVLGPRVRAGQVGQLDEALPAVVDLHERVRDPLGSRHRHRPARPPCSPSWSCSASWRCAAW